MIPVFSVRLEACDAARNRWRSYRVEAGRDLFGTWVVAVTFGRIGAARGRTVTYVAGDELRAQRLARACLRRRGSAPKRIGVAYVTRELIDPDGWTASVSDSSISGMSARQKQEEHQLTRHMAPSRSLASVGAKPTI